MEKSKHSANYIDDGAQYSHVFESKTKLYGVRDDGAFIITSKRDYAETYGKPKMKRGKVRVAYNGGDHPLDDMIAKAFIPEYRCYSDLIEHIDGDPFNCRVENLRLIPRSILAKKWGLMRRAKGISADGVSYKSLTACAKALHVSRGTLVNHIKNPNRPRSTLLGIDIRKLYSKEADDDFKAEFGC